MVVRNGHLLSRRQTGLRKRPRCGAVSSNLSGDSSDAKGFAQTPIQPCVKQKRSSSAQSDTERRVSKAFAGLC